MTQHSQQKPKPRKVSRQPAYPNLLTVGCLLAAACGGTAVEADPRATGGTGGAINPAGAQVAPHDAGTDSDQGYSGHEGGIAPPPFDSGTPDDDAGMAGGMPYPYDASPDSEPPAVGDVPAPYDAGPDSEPPAAGDVPAPYDGGTCVVDAGPKRRELK